MQSNVVHLRHHEKEEAHEENLEVAGRNLRGHEGTAEGPHEDAGGDALRHPPRDVAVAPVGQRAGNGGEHDAAHGRAECEEHDGLGREPLPAEGENQHGHDDDAPADAEQPGENAGKGPQCTVNCYGKKHINPSSSKKYVYG